MNIRTSGGGCGRVLLVWFIFFGIVTFLAGLGYWGNLKSSCQVTG